MDTENGGQGGVVLKTQNKELVTRVADLKVKREVLTKAIQDAEGEKSKFEEHIAVVRKRIAQLQDSLDRKSDLRNEYDKIIQETEAAYAKILESSQSLLMLLEHETNTMKNGKQQEIQHPAEADWGEANNSWNHAPESEIIV